MLSALVLVGLATWALRAQSVLTGLEVKQQAAYSFPTPSRAPSVRLAFYMVVDEDDHRTHDDAMVFPAGLPGARQSNLVETDAVATDEQHPSTSIRCNSTATRAPPHRGSI